MKGVSKYSFLLGCLGFSGFSGIYGEPSSLLWFGFLGGFSYFWWFKLGQFDDERLIENKYKAGSISFRVCFAIAFVLSVIFGLLNLDFELLYKIQLSILTLTFAVSVNLWAFLTYKFDLGD